MGEKQSSRDVAAVTPARDPWAEGYNPAGRDDAGGGYGRQVQAHLAADGLVRDTQPKGDPIAPVAPGGAGEDFWGRGDHWAG